jgi:hypothetical protein
MDTVVTTFIIIGDHFIIVVSLEERGSDAFYRSPISRACLRVRFTSCGDWAEMQR